MSRRLDNLSSRQILEDSRRQAVSRRILEVVSVTLPTKISLADTTSSGTIKTFKLV